MVGSWDKSLSIYRIQGDTQRLHGERKLKYYPCGLSLAAGSQNAAGSRSFYIVIVGSQQRLALYSADGLLLSETTVAVDDKSWRLTASCHLESNRVVIGSDAGGVEMLQMHFDAVHSLHLDRYAFRENLTEVVVHHLVTDRKVRIKCRDLVRSLAIYKNKLAVQLTDKICIYESNPEDFHDMHFKLRKERIPTTAHAQAKHNLMLNTANHVLYLHDRAMHLYSYEGPKVRSWNLDSAISYAKVEGGKEDREAVLLGLKDGSVRRVYIDNPFPIELRAGSKKESKNTSVVSLSMSAERSFVAVVDSAKRLQIIELASQNSIYSAENVLAVFFNNEVNDMVCYASEETVHVVSGVGLPGRTAVDLYEQRLHGAVIGFTGQRIYCVSTVGVSFIDVPQGANMQKAIAGGDMSAAYRLACLGATETDWRLLGMKALMANDLRVAKNAFARLKDTKYLSLIDTIRYSDEKAGIARVSTSAPPADPSRRARGKATGEAPVTAAKIGLDPSWHAEVLAYEGHHMDAAKAYARNGKVSEAIRLMTDMRRWDDAKMFAQNAGVSDVGQLTQRQAEWLVETHDWKGASELFISLGQYQQAATIVAESNGPHWASVLIDVVRSTPKDQKEVLRYCGEKFTATNEDAYAKETYIRLGDMTQLMSLYARRQMWAEAAKLAEEFEGEIDSSVFVPYAEWLVSEDRYEDAMVAYRKAKRGDLAKRVIEALTFNAVVEARYKDAAYYYWMLSQDKEETKTTVLTEYEFKADLYYAYAPIHAFVTDPFTSHQPEMLFQMSRFLVNCLSIPDYPLPYGISLVNILFTLARQSMILGAFKLARSVYERLSKLKLSAKLQDDTEVDKLTVQAKPVRDEPDLMPACYRCGAVNPLLNPGTNKYARGDVCNACCHPFIRSFSNFEMLPLVEFIPDSAISTEEAIDLIRQPYERKRGRLGGKWKESKEGQADTLTFDGASEYDEDVSGDLFSKAINVALDGQGRGYTPIVCDANVLLEMNRTEVFICHSNTRKKTLFYRNMLPEIAIAVSQPCCRFFHLEDFEMAYLSHLSCPYSRVKELGDYGSM